MKGEQEKGERMRETQLRKRGVVVLFCCLKPSINSQGYFWQREKQKRTACVCLKLLYFCPDWGEMIGLNKNASNNRKEISPIVFLAWSRHCWKCWPPCLPQGGQGTEGYSCNCDERGPAGDMFLTSLWSAARLSCLLVCLVIVLVRDLFAATTALVFNKASSGFFAATSYLERTERAVQRMAAEKDKTLN